MSENAENKSTAEQVAPAPATTETPAKVEAPAGEAKPTESPAEIANNKQTAAFIKMRQEARELKRQLAEAKANTPAPAAPATPEQPKTEIKEIPPAPAPNIAVSDIEAEGKKAIEALAADKEVSAVPGAVIDILDILDSDPRLTRLYQIDPTIAVREAKGMWASKAGIATPPPVAKSTTPSGGMASDHKDIESLMTEIAKHRPGTREYSRLANQINAEMKRQGIA
mgnify:FL=1